jgi:hypothetical protein
MGRTCNTEHISTTPRKGKNTMRTLPSQVKSFLVRLVTGNRPLAYLRSDKAGNLLEWGGQTDHFSLPPLKKGEPIGKQVYYLEGLVPSSKQILSVDCVELDPDLLIEIHIFPELHSEWTLLLGASERTHERRLLLRKIQQLEEDSP